MALGRAVTCPNSKLGLVVAFSHEPSAQLWVAWHCQGMLLLCYEVQAGARGSLMKLMITAQREPNETHDHCDCDCINTYQLLYCWL
jgi:hypothetical protein